ncbi:MAG: hypothetical protein WC554_01870 [Clostridia bacterium]|jgi:hypothetical protein
MEKNHSVKRNYLQNAKNWIVKFFQKVFSRNVVKTLTDEIKESHQFISTKRPGKGRAFYNNRKRTKGRPNQYIPIFKDQLGNTHYKLICHSY